MKQLSFSSGRYKNDVLNVRPAGRPRMTHGSSAGRRAQPVTEWTKFGLFLGGRLRSSTDCQQMGVPFWVRYEDRLFPRGMKSRSRLAALWDGHGQQFASRNGFLGWENMTEFDIPLYVNNKIGYFTPSFEYSSVCYVKPLEWAAGVAVCDLSNSFGAGGSATV